MTLALALICAAIGGYCIGYAIGRLNDAAAAEIERLKSERMNDRQMIEALERRVSVRANYEQECG